jgi:serine/threonine protein kinase
MTRTSWIGQTLGGRYRIDDILGQGGMSAVYKAYDPNLKRVVAIKMIHSHLAEDPQFVTRFKEEAAAVAQLRHPHIVQVFDFNSDNNLYYMVQEFVAGETLQERLRRLNKSGRHMPFDEAIRYITHICEAAHYGHQRGLVHRDIKPANIIIDIHGQAILMDFGIVKITGGQKHTATGAVVGTAVYLPPEAIRGETPDGRADQYSLAVTLFEALSGRPPFEADSAMTLMMMHLNDPLPDLRQLRPDTPSGLVAVIEKALSKNRQQRYPNMLDFAKALRQELDTLSRPSAVLTQAGQPTSQEPQPATGSDDMATYIPDDVVHETQAAITYLPEPDFPEIAPTVPPDRPARNKQTPATPQPAIPTEKVNTPPPQSTGQNRTADAKSGATTNQETPPSPKSGLFLWDGLGCGLLLIVGVVILVAGGFLLSRFLPSQGAEDIQPTPSEALLAAAPTSQASETPTPTITATQEPTATSAPTLTPTITQSPTPTIPAGVPYSRINGIDLNAAGIYVVDYETFEYTETLPGDHVHFFFDTVAPDQAGVPGNGPWKLYGGPRPFQGYRASDRPDSAAQLCILVANANHSVQPNSGNCFILPDVNAAVPVYADACLAGPDPAYPTVAQLTPGEVLLVNGISADEAWWTVENPENPAESCWLQRNRSDFSGDISTLPLAKNPPLPEGSSSTLSIQITAITLDAQGRYSVEFTTSGFTPALPGTHMHFFFDIYAAEQTGSGGNRLMYGGASPFIGYSQANLPQGATQICVLVANPDHTVIENSGNCYPLP